MYTGSAADGTGAAVPVDSARDLLEFRAALNAAEVVEDVAAAVLSSAAASNGADAVSVGVLDRETNTLRVSFVGDIPGEQRDRYYVVAADGPGPMAEAMRTGRTIVVENADKGEARHRSVLEDFGDILRAFVFHPLCDAAGTPIGAITLGWSTPRTFTSRDLKAMASSVALVGVALARVRAAERERRIATDLQEHLLDLDRSSLAAAVAARYQSASEATRVGGDWYLVAAAQDPRRVALCVGDVVGRGLPAASVMSRLRSAIAAASTTLADPGAVLDLVERYARTVRGAHCSTVAYAVLDAGEGRLRYACAGHPYPLLVGPDGRTQYLQEGRRPPLSAVWGDVAQGVGTADFPPGSLLVLYTDGLLERRGERLEDGLARLGEAAAGCASLPVGSVCSTLLDRMSPPGGYTDDVALLAVRPQGTTATSFVDVLPADPHEMVNLRARLRDWLAAVCPEQALQYDVLIGVGEALSNAIDHGSADHPDSTVSVEVHLDGNGGLSATVSDTGRWAGDSSASQREAVRGRGLKLIHGLSSRVETVRTTHGTQVTMHHECRA